MVIITTIREHMLCVGHSHGLSFHVYTCFILQMSKLSLDRISTLSKVYQVVRGGVSVQVYDVALTPTFPTIAG